MGRFNPRILWTAKRAAPPEAVGTVVRLSHSDVFFQRFSSAKNDWKIAAMRKLDE